MQAIRRLGVAALTLCGIAGVLCLAPGPAGALTSSRSGLSGSSPIKHVVVLLEENHSFDNVLGKFCSEVASGAIVRPGYGSGCDGVTTGYGADGQPIPLAAAPNHVPEVPHGEPAQVADIAGGTMDGFDSRRTCANDVDGCYAQYDPLSGPCLAGSCIPNEAALATRFTVSDRTFELQSSASWAGHLDFASANQDGFFGNNPTSKPVDGAGPRQHGGGWGCDSGSTSPWTDPSGQTFQVPSCVAMKDGSLGPNWVQYTGPRASYVPTIFDRLDSAHLSWRIYGGTAHSSGSRLFQPTGWQWAICPSFAQCLYSAQRKNLVPASNVITDAHSGQLPSYSIVTPTAVNSEHNSFFMDEGDDFIGSVLSAIEDGPQWKSTAVFITYDDCGCFYDHVNPMQYNPTWGIRVPMVIVSPYAKLGFTDSTPTSFAGILAFVEHTFGLAPLNTSDATAYDYANSFCFDPSEDACQPAGDATVGMVRQPVPTPTPAQRAGQRAAMRQDT